jgi:hypothetical protein
VPRLAAFKANRQQIVFGVSWWGTRAVLDAADIGTTPLGGLLARGLPMLFVLPPPLYLTDRFLIGRAPRASPRARA